MNTIRIALFNNRAQAEPTQQRLARAGIAAEIHEELGLQRFWFVSKRSAGARLEVPAKQLEQARKLLAAWDVTEGALDHAIHCPQCQSLCVDYPQFAHHSVLTNMAAGLVAELGLVEKDYYCEECHYTWPKEQTAPARARRHTAPYYFIEDVEDRVSPLMRQNSSEPVGAGRAVSKT